MALTPPGSNDFPEKDVNQADERRRNPRFAMRFSVFLRSPAGDNWIPSCTANVSAGGAYFPSDVVLAPDEAVEYVLTFPSELTHAPIPLRVRFQGYVVRVERRTGSQPRYGVAVSSSSHRYLSREEAEAFSSLESQSSRGAAARAWARTGI